MIYKEHIPIIKDLFQTALDDKRWMVEKPKFDFADSVSVANQLRRKTYRPEIVHPIYPVIKQVLDTRYPNLPDDWVLSVYFSYYAVDRHPVQLNVELTAAQKNDIQQYVLDKLNNSSSFPFPKVISYDVRKIYEVYFGIRAFAHDLYQPMLMQHRTKPKSFLDATAGIIRMCPTVSYDLPEAICKEFPVVFMLLNPFFTYPRPVSLLYGRTNQDYKMSLFDLYCTDQAESLAASFNPTFGEGLIDCLYESDAYRTVAKNLMNRAITASGGVSNLVNLPENLQDFLLQKELMRERVRASKGCIHINNIKEATAEALFRNTIMNVDEAQKQAREAAQAASLIKR